LIDILYRSERLQVRQVRAGDGRRQVVTFDSYHEQPGMDRPGFGEHYFAERGITAMHVMCRDNDWFQYPDMLQVLDAIRAAAAGADRLLSYGSSMGGYGALRFAAAIGADAALALSPQFTLDRRKVPFETRWAQDQRRIRFLPALDGAIAPVPLMVMAYDPRSVADRRHAELILASAPSVMAIPLPFAGHPVGQFLNDVALLDPLVQASLDGKVDGPTVIQTARRDRGRSAQWLAHLAASQPASRPRLSVGLAMRAADLAPDRAAMFDGLGLRLAAAGRFEEAVRAHERAIAIEPVVDYRWGLTKTLHAAGDLPAALRVARLLQDEAPHVAGYHAWAAKLQSLMGDKVGELADLRRALALDPTNPAYRFVVRKLGWQIRIGRWLRAMKGAG
jgi:tetratricopeptide (TPR) repeat protein